MERELGAHALVEAADAPQKLVAGMGVSRTHASLHRIGALVCHCTNASFGPDLELAKHRRVSSFGHAIGQTIPVGPTSIARRNPCPLRSHERTAIVGRGNGIGTAAIEQQGIGGRDAAIPAREYRVGPDYLGGGVVARLQSKLGLAGAARPSGIKTSTASPSHKSPRRPPARGKLEAPDQSCHATGMSTIQ